MVNELLSELSYRKSVSQDIQRRFGRSGARHGSWRLQISVLDSGLDPAQFAENRGE